MIYSKSCAEKSSCRLLGWTAYEGRRVWGLEWVTHTENSVKIAVVELVTAYSQRFWLLRLVQSTHCVLLDKKHDAINNGGTQDTQDTSQKLKHIQEIGSCCH